MTVVTPTMSTWLGVIFTLFAFSFLYKENPFYRFAEHTLVAMQAAYTAVLEYYNYIKPAVQQDILKNGKTWLILAILIGLLYYTMFHPKVSWLSRFPVSIAVGYGVGYNLAYTPRPFLVQIRDSFTQIKDVNSLLFILFLLCTLTYFIFTISHESKVVRYGAIGGRWIMMLTFGYMFGNTVQGRFSLLLGRFLFLMKDAFHLVK